MADARVALIIASYQYEDPGLRQLVAPPQDAEALARVLGDPAIGGFQVRTLLNEPSYRVDQEIEAFFADLKRDDLVLLYFSGHGVKDEDGQLYFAMPDTRRNLLRSTAVPSSLVNDVMRRSRSRQQVLVLDCCYSGAFARGMLAKAGAEIGTKERFEGRGRVVLTASDAMQYSFEGDVIKGEGISSIFTRTFVRGLETGEADGDGDGQITIDEIYDYVHDRVWELTPRQRPGKWEFDVQGDLVIARNPRPLPKPAALPVEVQQAIESPLASVREGVVRELGQFLRGSHAGLALAAHEALQRLTEDDSRRVADAARRALTTYAESQRAGWIGYMLGNRYRIEALLGQGGMSSVYKGVDLNLRRPVAIKLIHPHLSSDPEFVRRFEMEAAAVARLRHPNIVQVFDFDHEGDVYFMVLVYLEGETLQARLKALDEDKARLPLAETIRLTALICDAVAYAHQEGIVHRDLKPANVMLDQHDQPILMDFGVAKMLGEQRHTATGAIVGTVAYMSPEQLRGDPFDGRADIYSLGVMLYEMTAGRPPFVADSVMTLMLKHLNEPVPDIREFAAGVPDELVVAIEKALAKTPAERFQTVAEMAEALRAIDLARIERERLAKERAVAERVAKQKAEQERLARERAEQERLAKEKAEAERIARQKAEEERLARERAEQERLAKEKAEKERLARERAEVERLAKQKAEQERLAREKADAERIARQKAEEERRARERADQERLAKEKAERERLARERAEQEKREREAAQRAEAERVAKQKAEQERLARERAEQERRKREAERARRMEQFRALLSNRAVLLIVAGVALLGLGLLVVVPRLVPQLPSAEGMVRVEGGKYTVGHDAAGENYVSPHDVQLTTFWIDRYEVTNVQYAKFVDETNAEPPAGWVNRSPPVGKDDHPVEGVTWDQASAFCSWKNKRLPSEAEWEVAARGPDRSLYPWGDERDAVSLPADDTYPVGTEENNISEFKVFDMAGNVWEWIGDPYAPVEDGERVIRGGAHGFLVDMAHRVRGDPNNSSMYRNAGVRCAASQVEGGQ
ncbi:MAG TPA: SUMF1/EgtB/PvdO family nonheme iron enzyme [Anaerolineae bacterium]|nr:SUMF1/EgtB/PvdO family nonheme iron enzyme [Anaerolineae bacterium]